MDILKRLRTDPTIVAYCLYLYFNSRSYRLASTFLEPLKKRALAAYQKKKEENCMKRRMKRNSSKKTNLQQKIMNPQPLVSKQHCFSTFPLFYSCSRIRRCKQPDLLDCKISDYAGFIRINGSSDFYNRKLASP